MSTQERSQAQIEASRANGRKSKGPVSTLGKFISSQNAITHGLLTDFPRTTLQDDQHMSEISRHLIAERHANTPDEIARARHDAYAQWKLHKIRTTGLTYIGAAYEHLLRGRGKVSKKRVFPNEPTELVDSFRTPVEDVKPQPNVIPS